MGLRIHYTGIEIDGNRFPSVLTLSPSCVSRLFLFTLSLSLPRSLSLSFRFSLLLFLSLLLGGESLGGSRVISPRFHNVYELYWGSSDGTNSIISFRKFSVKRRSSARFSAILDCYILIVKFSFSSYFLNIKRVIANLNFYQILKVF